LNFFWDTTRAHMQYNDTFVREPFTILHQYEIGRTDIFYLIQIVLTTHAHARACYPRWAGRATRVLCLQIIRSRHASKHEGTLI
jgi:hypothetical protein